MGEVASRLKDEVAENSQKLEELESKLKRNQQSAGIVQKDIGEIILILNAADDELAADSLYRGVLEREAAGIRGAATQTEEDLDRGIRQKAPDLQHRVAEIEAAERDAEEMRTRLVTHIDLLEALRQRMQFAHAAARLEELLKNAQGYLNGIQAVATRTERLATELYDREGSVANTSQAPIASSVAAPSPASTASKPNAARPLLQRVSPQTSTATSTREPSTTPSQ